MHAVFLGVLVEPLRRDRQGGQRRFRLMIRPLRLRGFQAGRG
ncbi:MAG: hypothetical protein ACE5K7_02285 [Phycisphaerae bacterium]